MTKSTRMFSLTSIQMVCFLWVLKVVVLSDADKRNEKNEIK